MTNLKGKFPIKHFLGLSVLVLQLGLSQPAMAARFANQFTEFELPPQWQCNLEGAEWVCQSSNDVKKRDAIIVLAAKLKGEQDSLDQYLNYLKAPKTYMSIQKKPVKSDAKYAKTVNINGHPWIDALHMESEIPGFYTRYLATVVQDIGVLVTYSINKGKYQDYLGDFDNMVKTLKVFRKAGAINVGSQKSNLFENTTIPAQGVATETIFPGSGVGESEDKEKKTKKSGSSDDLLMLGAAVVGLILFFVWRRKRG